MDAIYKNEKLKEVDKSITSTLIEKIFSSLQCTVCHDVMYVPFSIKCGHTFCYDCLVEWFKKRPNCPSCRYEVEEQPSLNTNLREIVDSYIESAIIISPELAEDLNRAKLEATELFQADLRNKKIFKSVLKKTAFTIIDRADGVPRCGNCQWEAHGSTCIHCGVRFRRRVDDEPEDFDDEEHDPYSEEDNDDDDSNSDSDSGVIPFFRQMMNRGEFLETDDDDELYIDGGEIVSDSDSDSSDNIQIHINSINSDEHSNWAGFDSDFEENNSDATAGDVEITSYRDHSEEIPFHDHSHETEVASDYVQSGSDAEEQVEEYPQDLGAFDDMEGYSDRSDEYDDGMGMSEVW